MKKIALAMSFLAAVCSAKAQIDDDLGKNALKLNPLSILVATGNISYERVTTEKQSFQFGVFYTGVKLSGTKYRGFGITPEYRWPRQAGHEWHVRGSIFTLSAFHTGGS